MENSILKNFFKEYLQLYPSFSSFLGDRSTDSHYENVLDRSHNIKYGRLMAKYEKKVAKQDKSRSVDVQILRWIINDNKDSQKYPLNLIPLSSFENWIIEFTFVNKSMYPLKNLKDLDNLLSRHVEFMSYIRRCIDKMEVGIKQKVVLPKIICTKLIESLEEFYNNKKYIVDIPYSLKIAHPKATGRYLSFVTGPYAFTLQKLISFLKTKYLNACRHTVGLCDMPRGRNMYKYLVKSMTTLDITPEYVHKLGLREVKRISNDINTIKILLGYPDSISLSTFNQTMLTNSKNYYKREDRLLKEYKNQQKYIDEEIIPKNFHNNVEDYAIKRVPKSMEQTSAGAFYYPGSVLSMQRKGTFYVNMRDMKENPKFNMMALSLHEGKPGHHYQFQYMIESKLPIYRQYAINSTAFVEGWALYAESLGNYKNNPYDYFGKLTYELFRAVRLVVDSGLHYYNWTYEDAVEYMQKYLAISKSEIETEVQRYICIPGQALCYKIGERKIAALKQKYMKVLGYNQQNVKDFHKYVLEDGIVPLVVLERKMNKIIAAKEHALRTEKLNKPVKR